MRSLLSIKIYRDDASRHALSTEAIAMLDRSVKLLGLVGSNSLIFSTVPRLQLRRTGRFRLIGNTSKLNPLRLHCFDSFTSLTSAYPNLARAEASNLTDCKSPILR